MKPEFFCSARLSKGRVSYYLIVLIERMTKLLCWLATDATHYGSIVTDFLNIISTRING